jgi:hypothetical protein
MSSHETPPAVLLTAASTSKRKYSGESDGVLEGSCGTGDGSTTELMRRNLDGIELGCVLGVTLGTVLGCSLGSDSVANWELPWGMASW